MAAKSSSRRHARWARRPHGSRDASVRMRSGADGHGDGLPRPPPVGRPDILVLTALAAAPTIGTAATSPPVGPYAPMGAVIRHVATVARSSHGPTRSEDWHHQVRSGRAAVLHERLQEAAAISFLAPRESSSTAPSGHRSVSTMQSSGTARAASTGAVQLSVWGRFELRGPRRVRIESRTVPVGGAADWRCSAQAFGQPPT